MGTFWRHFGPFGGPFWHFWGVRGDLFGTFGRSGAHFEAGTFKKGGGDFGGVAFGPEKSPQGLPKRFGKAPKLRPRGFQEATKRAFERKTSKTSKMTTFSMKMLDFEGLEGFENHQILVQNGFKHKKNSMRSASSVAKRLRKPFSPENCALHRLIVL